jgi:hypothetical protein
MKKIFLFSIIFNMAFANVNYKVYENYVNDILNYSLPFDYSFYNPFYVPHKKIITRINRKKLQVNKPKSKLKILAILNNKVLLNFSNIRKKTTKWLKIGKSLENYKLISIKKNTVLFKYKNKIKVLPIDIKTDKFKLKISK